MHYLLKTHVYTLLCIEKYSKIVYVVYIIFNALYNIYICEVKYMLYIYILSLQLETYP
jgi:hypothetical protein